MFDVVVFKRSLKPGRPRGVATLVSEDSVVPASFSAPKLCGDCCDTCARGGEPARLFCALCSVRVKKMSVLDKLYSDLDIPSSGLLAVEGRFLVSPKLE